MQGSVRNTTGYVNYVYNISARGTAQVTSQLMGLSGVAGNIIGQLAFQTSSYLSNTENSIMTLGIAATAGFTKAAQKALDFNQALATIGAISGKTTDDVASLGDKAMDMSAKFGVAVGEMTEGLESLARAGVSENNMGAILEQAMGLSKLEGLPLEQSINDLISTTNLLDTKGLDLYSPEYADAVRMQNQRITATSEAAPINARDIIHTLEHVGGYASSANIDQKDLFAVIAQLGSKGTKSEIAGTSLRAFLAAGQKDTAQRALKRIGLDVKDLWKDDETMMSISDMKDVLDEAMDARGYTKQEKLEFYSDFAGYKQANQIMKIDTTSVREFKNKIDNSWDMSKKIEQVIGTAQTNLRGMYQAGMNFVTKVGEPLLPIISLIAKTGKTVITVIDKIPGIHIVGALGLALASMKGFSLIIKKIVPQLLLVKGEFQGVGSIVRSIHDDMEEIFKFSKLSPKQRKQYAIDEHINTVTEEQQIKFMQSQGYVNVKEMPEYEFVYQSLSPEEQLKYTRENIINERRKQLKENILKQKSNEDSTEEDREQKRRSSKKGPTLNQMFNHIKENFDTKLSVITIGISHVVSAINKVAERLPSEESDKTITFDNRTLEGLRGLPNGISSLPQNIGNVFKKIFSNTTFKVSVVENVCCPGKVLKKENKIRDIVRKEKQNNSGLSFVNDVIESDRTSPKPTFQENKRIIEIRQKGMDEEHRNKVHSRMKEKEVLSKGRYEFYDDPRKNSYIYYTRGSGGYGLYRVGAMPGETKHEMKLGDKKLDETLEESFDNIVSLIKESKGMEDDVLLYNGGRKLQSFDSGIGATTSIKSLTFSEKQARDHFKKKWDNHGDMAYLNKIHVPKGTKGIYTNTFKNEQEFTIGPDQLFLEIARDEKNREAEFILLTDELIKELNISKKTIQKVQKQKELELLIKRAYNTYDMKTDHNLQGATIPDFKDDNTLFDLINTVGSVDEFLKIDVEKIKLPHKLTKKDIKFLKKIQEENKIKSGQDVSKSVVADARTDVMFDAMNGVNSFNNGFGVSLDMGMGTNIGGGMGGGLYIDQDLSNTQGVSSKDTKTKPKKKSKRKIKTKKFTEDDVAYAKVSSVETIRMIKDSVKDMLDAIDTSHMDENSKKVFEQIKDDVLDNVFIHNIRMKGGSNRTLLADALKAIETTENITKGSKYQALVDTLSDTKVFDLEAKRTSNKKQLTQDSLMINPRSLDMDKNEQKIQDFLNNGMVLDNKTDLTVNQLNALSEYLRGELGEESPENLPTDKSKAVDDAKELITKFFDSGERSVGDLANKNFIKTVAHAGIAYKEANSKLYKTQDKLNDKGKVVKLGDILGYDDSKKFFSNRNLQAIAELMGINPMKENGIFLEPGKLKEKITEQPAQTITDTITRVINTENDNTDIGLVLKDIVSDVDNDEKQIEMLKKSIKSKVKKINQKKKKKKKAKEDKRELEKLNKELDKLEKEVKEREKNITPKRKKLDKFFKAKNIKGESNTGKLTQYLEYAKSKDTSEDLDWILDTFNMSIGNLTHKLTSTGTKDFYSQDNKIGPNISKASNDHLTSEVSRDLTKNLSNAIKLLTEHQVRRLLRAAGVSAHHLGDVELSLLVGSEYKKNVHKNHDVPENLTEEDLINEAIDTVLQNQYDITPENYIGLRDSLFGTILLNEEGKGTRKKIKEDLKNLKINNLFSKLNLSRTSVRQEHTAAKRKEMPTANGAKGFYWVPQFGNHFTKTDDDKIDKLHFDDDGNMKHVDHAYLRLHRDINSDKTDIKLAEVYALLNGVDLDEVYGNITEEQEREARRMLGAQAEIILPIVGRQKMGILPGGAIGDINEIYKNDRDFFNKKMLPNTKTKRISMEEYKKARKQGRIWLKDPEAMEDQELRGVHRIVTKKFKNEETGKIEDKKFVVVRDFDEKLKQSDAIAHSNKITTVADFAENYKEEYENAKKLMDASMLYTDKGKPIGNPFEIRVTKEEYERRKQSGLIDFNDGVAKDGILAIYEATDEFEETMYLIRDWELNMNMEAAKKMVALRDYITDMNATMEEFRAITQLDFVTDQNTKDFKNIEIGQLELLELDKIVRASEHPGQLLLKLYHHNKIIYNEYLDFLKDSNKVFEDHLDFVVGGDPNKNDYGMGYSEQNYGEDVAISDSYITEDRSIEDPDYYSNANRLTQDLDRNRQAGFGKEGEEQEDGTIRGENGEKYSYIPPSEEIISGKDEGKDSPISIMGQSKNKELIFLMEDIKNNETAKRVKKTSKNNEKTKERTVIDLLSDNVYDTITEMVWNGEEEGVVNGSLSGDALNTIKNIKDNFVFYSQIKPFVDLVENMDAYQKELYKNNNPPRPKPEKPEPSKPKLSIVDAIKDGDEDNDKSSDDSKDKEKEKSSGKNCCDLLLESMQETRELITSEINNIIGFLSIGFTEFSTLGNVINNTQREEQRQNTQNEQQEQTTEETTKETKESTDTTNTQEDTRVKPRGLLSFLNETFTPGMNIKSDEDKNVLDKFATKIEPTLNKVMNNNPQFNQDTINDLKTFTEYIDQPIEFLSTSIEELQGISDFFAPLTIAMASIKETLSLAQTGVGKVHKFLDMSSKISEGRSIKIFGKEYGKDSIVGKIIENFGAKLSALIPIVEGLLGPLAILGASIWGIKKILDWSYESHKKNLQQLETEQKENRSKTRSLKAQAEQAKKLAEGNTKEERQQYLDDKYKIAQTKLDSANIKRQHNAIEYEGEKNHMLWGQYGITANIDKIRGNYQSTAEEYEGTSRKIREIKEAQLGHLLSTPAMRQASAYYDHNKLSFAMIDEYKEELGQLYDLETNIKERTGTDNPRETEEFQRALDKFVEATGIERDHAEQYLDYMQVEHNVSQAESAMRAQAEQAAANTEMKVQAIAFGGNPADILGLNGIERQQEVMIQAQADIVKQQVAGQLWWKAVWATITAPFKLIVAPLLAIIDILGAMWELMTGNIDGAFSMMQNASSHFNALSEASAYWSGWAEIESMSLGKTGKEAVDENDRANYGSEQESTGGLRGTKPIKIQTGRKEETRNLKQNKDIEKAINKGVSPITMMLGTITGILGSGLLITGLIVGLRKFFRSTFFRNLRRELSNVIGWDKIGGTIKDKLDGYFNIEPLKNIGRMFKDTSVGRMASKAKDKISKVFKPIKDFFFGSTDVSDENPITDEEVEWLKEKYNLGDEEDVQSVLEEQGNWEEAKAEVNERRRQSKAGVHNKEKDKKVNCCEVLVEIKDAVISIRDYLLGVSEDVDKATVQESKRHNKKTQDAQEEEQEAREESIKTDKDNQKTIKDVVISGQENQKTMGTGKVPKMSTGGIVSESNKVDELLSTFGIDLGGISGDEGGSISGGVIDEVLGETIYHGTGKILGKIGKTKLGKKIMNKIGDKAIGKTLGNLGGKTLTKMGGEAASSLLGDLGIAALGGGIASIGGKALGTIGSKAIAGISEFLASRGLAYEIGGTILGDASLFGAEAAAAGTTAEGAIILGGETAAGTVGADGALIAAGEGALVEGGAAAGGASLASLALPLAALASIVLSIPGQMEGAENLMSDFGIGKKKHHEGGIMNSISKMNVVGGLMETLGISDLIGEEAATSIGLSAGIPIFGPIIDRVTSFWGPVLSGIGDWIDGTVSDITGSSLGGILGEGIAAGKGWLFAKGTEFLKNVPGFDNIKKDIKSFTDDPLGTLFNGKEGIWNDVTTYANNLIDSGTTWLSEAPGNLWNWGKDTAGSTWDGITSFLGIGGEDNASKTTKETNKNLKKANKNAPAQKTKDINKKIEKSNKDKAKKSKKKAQKKKDKSKKKKEQKNNIKNDNSGSGNITIQNININTNDDPESIKEMFLELIIELQEQTNPRLVSRQINKNSE